MSRHWKPGDVAVIRTEGGDEEVYGLRDTHGWAHLKDWISPSQSHACWTNRSQVTVVRPLVVIDPEDREQCLRLAAAISEHRAPGPNVYNVQAALRSLVTVHKPDEPTGLGAVVEDADGEAWVRCTADTTMWRKAARPARGAFRPWSDIAAVKVLSDGVTA